MEGIIPLIIIFLVVNSIVRMVKKAGLPAKKPMTQAEVEATKPKAPPKPASKPADFRFPTPVVKPAPIIAQEGRKSGAVMTEYTPIQSSMDLQNRFTDYQGSLKSPVSEGTGYQTEAYDESPVPYQTAAANGLNILPERFTRDALVQAVVMSEILKRPGVRK